MLKISGLILFLSSVCSFAFSANALTKDDDLLRDPLPLVFETLLCGTNLYNNIDQHLEISRVCWIRSKKNYNDLEYPEALRITFENGEDFTLHLSPFALDLQLSRMYGSQILKSTARGQSSSGYTLTYIYKEYLNNSSLARAEKPVKIFGTLPSGHRFIIKRNL